MKGYMITTPCLRDGKYKTHGKLNWHQKLKVRVALRLFQSVPKPYDMEIKTTNGSSNCWWMKGEIAR